MKRKSEDENEDENEDEDDCCRQGHAPTTYHRL